MRAYILSFGSWGMHLMDGILSFGMADLLEADALRLIQIGKSEEDVHTLRQEVLDYTQLRGMYGLSEHRGFGPAVSLAVWPEEGLQGSILEMVETESDRLLMNTLFRESETLRRNLSSSLAVSQLAFSEKLSGEPDGAMRDLVAEARARDDTEVILIGSLTDAECASGILAVSRMLHDHLPSEKISCILALPLREKDLGGACREVLSLLPREGRFLSLIGLPQDMRFQGETEDTSTGGSIADLIMLRLLQRCLRGDRGAFTFSTDEGSMWQVFEADEGFVRERLERLVEALATARFSGIPSAMEVLSQGETRGRRWERQLRWAGALYAHALGNEEESIREERLLSALGRMGDMLFRFLLSAQKALPLTMVYSQELEAEAGKSAAHYEQILTVAGQLALEHYDFQMTGLPSEGIVHRGDEEDSEEEKALKHLRGGESVLEEMEEQQRQMDEIIGGRLTLSVLREALSDSSLQEAGLKADIDEAMEKIRLAEERKAQEGARDADGEEPEGDASEDAQGDGEPLDLESLQSRIDAAKARLTRMQRLDVILEGRKKKAADDLQRAREKRKEPPKLGDLSVRPMGKDLFAESFLEGLMMEVPESRKEGASCLVSLDQPFTNFSEMIRSLQDMQTFEHPGTAGLLAQLLSGR
ncbi:MAG: hypothetical protein IJ083_03660 [Clostridia bacterium]|nr:hypothetical protein [Clostridia bacterium]